MSKLRTLRNFRENAGLEFSGRGSGLSLLFPFKRLFQEQTLPGFNGRRISLPPSGFIRLMANPDSLCHRPAITYANKYGIISIRKIAYPQLRQHIFLRSTCIPNVELWFSVFFRFVLFYFLLRCFVPCGFVLCMVCMPTVRYCCRIMRFTDHIFSIILYIFENSSASRFDTTGCRSMLHCYRFQGHTHTHPNTYAVSARTFLFMDIVQINVRSVRFGSHLFVH